MLVGIEKHASDASGGSRNILVGIEKHASDANGSGGSRNILVGIEKHASDANGSGGSRNGGAFTVKIGNRTSTITHTYHSLLLLVHIKR
jgi:hypothetical protein